MQRLLNQVPINNIISILNTVGSEFELNQRNSASSAKQKANEPPEQTAQSSYRKLYAQEPPEEAKQAGLTLTEKAALNRQRLYAQGCDGRDRACNGATGGVHARVALLQQSTVQRMLGLTRTDSMQIRQPH